MNTRIAKYGIGQVVRHRLFPFRGVVFDVDPMFASNEEWWRAIPENVRPPKDQPFYHLIADGEDGGYVAYVSEQNLEADDTGQPVNNPQAGQVFAGFDHGRYRPRPRPLN